MNKKLDIITATDINLNKTELNQSLESAVNSYVRKRVAKEVKNLRKELKDDCVPDTDIKERCRELSLQLNEKYGNDPETYEYRNRMNAELMQRKDNYFVLRSTINDLNTLNEFSTEIERHGLQNHETLLPYKQVLEQCSKRSDLAHAMVKSRKAYINNFNGHPTDSINMEEMFEFAQVSDIETNDVKELHNFVSGMYTVPRATDDIEMYDRYGFYTPVDYSNVIAEHYFKHNTAAKLFSDRASAAHNTKHIPLNTKFVAKLYSNTLGQGGNRFPFISTNAVSCFPTMYANETTTDYFYNQRTLGQLLEMITDPKTSRLAKDLRPQIYMTYDAIRPTGDDYWSWNGLQVFDLDLKPIIENENDTTADLVIETIKAELFEFLQEFHWFLWVCKSASGRGLHIYTKVSPPHHVYVDKYRNEYISKYWYKVNYAAKVSVVYDIMDRLSQSNSSPFVNNPDSEYLENKYVDNVVRRITAGIRMGYDPCPLVNQNFEDLHPSMGLAKTVEGWEHAETHKRIFCRETKFNMREMEMIDLDLSCSSSEKAKEKSLNGGNEAIDWTKSITTVTDFGNVSPLPYNMINYNTRWNVCNTLASLYGKDGLAVAHVLLDSERCDNVAEINSFYACGLSNKKDPSKIGIDILRRNGLVKGATEETERIITDKFKHNIEKSLIRAAENTEQDFDEHLQPNEYLGTIGTKILEWIRADKINILFSPAGSGKTEFIKDIARKQRVLLVLPYISVINNKIESDPDIMDLFTTYYGGKSLKDAESGINAVTTFDTFSKCRYEQISTMYDYIFIDESHLLFTSKYRIEATSNAIKRIKEMFYISANDPYAAKICLMTGTHTGETFFFREHGNFMRVHKKMPSKNIQFLVCDDMTDCITRMADKIAALIEQGKRVLFPTNDGETYSERIAGMVQHILGRTVKYGYYKRSNSEQEICTLINDKNTVGDHEIIFCSNYLSVGVDINDTHEFVSFYFGDFSGYEIEQFNARIRRSGIDSYYCIKTMDSKGFVNDLLIEEPNLLLRATQEDVARFKDDKEIGRTKQEFLAEYDPVLHKIHTAGFSYFNGKIQFCLEEYELTMFENKYKDCMQHPLKIARELTNYGYTVSVSTDYEGLDMATRTRLKEAGIDSARAEKLRQHSLLIGTFAELIQHNYYENKNGLSYNNVIEWITQNMSVVQEDREMKKHISMRFDAFATPTRITVKNKEALKEMLKPAKFLISRYSGEKCLEILNKYVGENGDLNKNRFKRAINLLRLIDSSDSNEIGVPLQKTMERIYDFVESFESSGRMSYETYQSNLNSLTNDYIDNMNMKIHTIHAWNKVKGGITDLLLDIAVKHTTRDGILLTYNKLPDQDSNNVLNRRSVDALLTTVFSLPETTKKSKLRAKTIVSNEPVMIL